MMTHDDEQAAKPEEAWQAGAQGDPEVSAYLESIRKEGAAWLAEYTRRTNEIERRIADRWRHAFECYDLLVLVVQQALERSDTGFYAAAVSRQDHVYEALRTLAIRACQIAKEVRALMAKGYASAAATRWRALHEVHIVARLIELYDAPLAERYLRHNIVENNKLANAVEEVYRGIGQPVPSELVTAIANVRAEYAKLKALYASDPAFFTGDYGWASGFVKGQRIVDLEQAAGLADRRSAYRLVSGNIHGNILGAFAGSIITPEGEALVLGPSATGMGEPGLSAALSLVETERIFLRSVVRRDERQADPTSDTTSDPTSDPRGELALSILGFDTLFQDVVRAFQAVG